MGVAAVSTWLITDWKEGGGRGGGSGRKDELAGYRLGSAARRTQHRRVEGGVQEAAVRRAADALDVQLLSQFQLRAERATFNRTCKIEVLGWRRQLMTQKWQDGLRRIGCKGLAQLEADWLALG